MHIYVDAGLGAFPIWFGSPGPKTQHSPPPAPRENQEAFRCYWLLYSNTVIFRFCLLYRFWAFTNIFVCVCRCVEMSSSSSSLAQTFFSLGSGPTLEMTVDTLTQPSVLTVSIYELVTSSTVRYVQSVNFKTSTTSSCFYVSAWVFNFPVKLVPKLVVP